MELYVSEFSRYVIALLLVLYNYESFAVFRYREEERRKGIYFRQILLMFGFHLSSFLVICFETGDLIYLCFYAFQQIILYASVVLFKMLYPRTNRLAANNMCMLLAVGFLVLSRLSYEKAVRQFTIAVGSVIVALGIPYLIKKIRFIRRLTWLYAVAGLVSLIAVAALGAVSYGAKLSFTVAGIALQPSEFVKIIFLTYLVKI